MDPTGIGDDGFCHLPPDVPCLVQPSSASCDFREVEVPPETGLNSHYFQPYTSSTAQGGGGSFKKRKTIGEIGCCESRMSKQKH